jgi:hypothetical protein
VQPLPAHETGRIWQGAATDRSMIKETPLRKTVLVLALTAAFAGALAAPASAGPLPTTACELQDFLGYENVNECEDPAS